MAQSIGRKLRKGDKVRCIDDKGSFNGQPLKTIQYRGIYTVLGIQKWHGLIMLKENNHAGILYRKYRFYKLTNEEVAQLDTPQIEMKLENKMTKQYFKPGDRVCSIKDLPGIQKGAMYTVRITKDDVVTQSLTVWPHGQSYDSDDFREYTELADELDLKQPQKWNNRSTIEVIFPSSLSTNYAYTCYDPDIKVGDYVVVLDRRCPHMLYAVARVIETNSSRNSSIPIVAKVIPDTAYLRNELMLNLEDLQRRHTCNTDARNALNMQIQDAERQLRELTDAT